MHFACDLNPNMRGSMRPPGGVGDAGDQDRPV
jgi:hypothetical protein